MGKYKCLFFLLYQDYIQRETASIQGLEPYLERFARNLGNKSALVRPFLGDIESTRDQVRRKRWTEVELENIADTPSILMIEQDFEHFDPREHYWIQLKLSNKLNEGHTSVAEIGTMLEVLADAVKDTEVNPFEAAEFILKEEIINDGLKAFEAKPGLFGFSLDILTGIESLQRYIDHLRHFSSFESKS